MLSYMLPVEEKSQNTRNLSLNLNLQNTTSTTPSQHSSDTDQHEHDDLIDENTKLLNIERQDYVATTRLNGNGNLIKNGSNKVNYNMNITNNNLCNNNFNNNNNHNNNSIIRNGDSTKLAKEMDTVVATNNNLNNLNNNEETNSSNSDKKIIKMTKLGNKNVTLKRVSFGSSKGSMVETLVFETPTPLPEHAEREFFPSNTSQTSTTNDTNGQNDSGIELQEEVERSKVRVSFFQSSKPQAISPPFSDNQFYFGDNYYLNNYNNNNSLIDSFLQNTSSISETDNMTAVATLPPGSGYDRQISTESGWDNPFRPGGDLSREADEIVNLIKGGKPITPTGDLNLLSGNGLHEDMNGTTVVDGATKQEVSPLLSQQNGTKTTSPQKGSPLNGDATQTTQQPQTQVANQTIAGPQAASHVVIDEKKKKSCKCCVIQ